MSKLSARLKYRILRSPAASLVKAARKAPMGKILSRRRQLAEQLPSNSQIIDHTKALERDGYVRLDDLVDPAALAELAAAADSKIADKEAAPAPTGTSRKAYWTRLLDADLQNGKMPADTAFTRFALQPKLLSFLASTLGTLPLLNYVLLTLSKPTAGELSQSQLWHRDHDDIRTIKIFVYLTDVDDVEQGPFSFLPGPLSDKAGQSLRSHAPDSWLFERVNASDVVQMIAPKLSVFAVETSRCLHMGSRVAEGHERLLFTATYTTAPRIFGSQNSFVAVDDEMESAVLGQDLP